MAVPVAAMEIVELPQEYELPDIRTLPLNCQKAIPIMIADEKKMWEVEKEKEFNILIQQAKEGWDVNGVDEATKELVTRTNRDKVVQLLETKMILEGILESAQIQLQEAKLLSIEAVVRQANSAKMKDGVVIGDCMKETKNLNDLNSEMGISEVMDSPSWVVISGNQRVLPTAAEQASLRANVATAALARQALFNENGAPRFDEESVAAVVAQFKKQRIDGTPILNISMLDQVQKTMHT